MAKLADFIFKNLLLILTTQQCVHHEYLFCERIKWTLSLRYFTFIIVTATYSL